MDAGGAVGNHVLHQPLGFPANDGLKVGQRVVAIPYSLSGLKRLLFQAPLPVWRLLPALFCKLLEIPLLRLKFEIRCHGDPPCAGHPVPVVLPETARKNASKHRSEEKRLSRSITRL